MSIYDGGGLLIFNLMVGGMEGGWRKHITRGNFSIGWDGVKKGEGFKHSPCELLITL